MSLRLVEINNKKTWEDFLLGCKEKSFVQSWNWGEFQKMLKNKIWRWGIFENDDELVGVALVTKIMAKRGTFLGLAHGPLLKPSSNKLKIWQALLDKLKKTAKEEKASFLRVSTLWERNEENRRIFEALRFKTAPSLFQPDLTWVLDIQPTEEELLRGMRKTTRYLIKQGQENSDIEIFFSQKLEDLEIFYKLYQDTINRHNFVPYSLDYLKKEFLAFQPDNQILMFFGKYRGEILYSSLIIFWQNIAVYHQAATLLKYPKIPVSYLCQWEIIKEAKRRGCRFYDFWGIAPEDNPSHPWTSLSLFKKGFGGYKKEYVKTQDLPLSWKYWLTFLIEKARKIKRGL